MTKDQDRRVGWLRELVVGDVVIVRPPRGISAVRRVEKLTPTGYLTVGGDSYNPQGIHTGIGVDESYQWTLAQPTPEALGRTKAYKRREAWAQRLAKTRWEELDVDVLERVVRALDAP